MNHIQWDGENWTAFTEKNPGLTCSPTCPACLAASPASQPAQQPTQDANNG